MQTNLALLFCSEDVPFQQAFSKAKFLFIIVSFFIYDKTIHPSSLTRCCLAFVSPLSILR